MRPSEVLEKNRELIRALVIRHRLSNPRVFGSVAVVTTVKTAIWTFW